MGITLFHTHSPVNMRSASIILCLLPFCIAGLSIQDEERGIFSHDGCGEKKGKQGEGDCDSDDDCVKGLVCEFDNSWHGLGKDHCVAGPKTVNGKPSQWSQWSECSAKKCGTTGTMERTRSCIVPVFGGHPCPKGVSYLERTKCKALCKPACNPLTWEKFTFQCCTPDSPCYTGEGDCDRDEDCFGDLVCRRKNCGEGFAKRYSGNRPACCGLA